MMTAKQRKLARHALGLPNRDRRSYRNRFFANYRPGGDYEQWDAMWNRGLAERALVMDGDCYRFWLTETGAQMAINKGESLCPEDFPRATP